MTSRRASTERKSNELGALSQDQLARRIPPHLATTEHEQAITEFEQALMCAAEAFYRLAAAYLGPEGRDANLTGHECVILQQLMLAQHPRRISDLSRFANRDDISNIQYSLKKLINAGLVRKTQAAARRDTAYEITQRGRELSQRVAALRRRVLTEPTSEMEDIKDGLRSATWALGVLTGILDHGTRQLTQLEQVPYEASSKSNERRRVPSN